MMPLLPPAPPLTGTHVAQAGLELPMWMKMTLNFPSAEDVGVSQHSWFMKCWDLLDTPGQTLLNPSTVMHLKPKLCSSVYCLQENRSW